MKYISITEYAKQKGHSTAWIRKLCALGKIEGAYKAGRNWIIPV